MVFFDECVGDLAPIEPFSAGLPPKDRIRGTDVPMVEICRYCRVRTRPVCSLLPIFPMANSTSTRRTFLMTTIAAAVTATSSLAENSTTKDSEAVKLFLRKWDVAWAKHDATAIAALHTDNAVTVNRFGTVVRGKSDLVKALGFLHGAQGPFHNSIFPPLELLIERTIAPNVQIVQAKWQNPVMRPDGTGVPDLLCR